MKSLESFTPEVLKAITAHYQRFSGSTGEVELVGDCLVFDAPGAMVFAPGSSFVATKCPTKYIYNVATGRDVYGRPSRWYNLYRLFDELGIKI